MKRRSRLAALLLLLLLAVTSPIVAQEASPSPSAAPEWPSGDQLRRELQAIGFAFRVDRSSGDWLGWAPRASVVESPALSLGGAGSADASATFGFDLLQTDLLGGDVDGALTAFMEVAARLPLDSTGAERARRFIVNDLLTEPPELLEACYSNLSSGGAIVVVLETETGRATLHVASEPDAIDVDDEIDLADCAALSPSGPGPAPGDATSERVTIGTTSEVPFAFDPAELTLEGSLVTVVLTFRNDSAAEQSLTFDAPLDSDTGPVAPGASRLIVVRQLEPGDYPFHSSGDGQDMTGTIRIVEATPE